MSDDVQRTGWFAIVVRPPQRGVYLEISGREVSGPWTNAHRLVQQLPSLLHQYRQYRSEDALPLGKVTLLRHELSGLVSPDGWDEFYGRESGHATRGDQPAGGSSPADGVQTPAEPDPDDDTDDEEDA